jgi:hypothetical protein
VSGAVPPLPSMLSWHGAQHRDNFTFMVLISLDLEPIVYSVYITKLPVIDVIVAGEREVIIKYKDINMFIFF